MYEGVTGLILAEKPGEAPVGCQIVPELNQCVPCVLSGVWFLDSVMEVYLDLTPSLVTVLGQYIDKIAVVLFCRIEVGVTKTKTIGVDPTACHLGIIPAPSDQTSFLFAEIGIPAIMRH